jgi:hypothetical protein
MHDRNGHPLNVGDRVNIPAIITSCFPSDVVNKYCNIGVALEVKMGLDDEKAYIMTMSLNAAQVEKSQFDEEA